MREPLCIIFNERAQPGILRLPWPNDPEAHQSVCSLQRSVFSVVAEFVWQLYTLRLAPQSFQVIKLPRLLFEHVYDEVAVIEQDPFGSLVTFNTRCRFARLLQLLVDL